MHIILLGSPGAGKGTQAQRISETFHIPEISTGDMLRKAVQDKTHTGLAVKQIMETGKLVPDDIMIHLIEERLIRADCKKGFLLDGFPRTIAQAKALEAKNIHINYVIQIYVPEEDIIKRMSGRLMHLASGRVYHIENYPPKNPGKDDITNEPLILREDDKEETVRERLKIYHQQTEPLLDYYQKKSIEDKQLVFAKVCGSKSANDVYECILKVLTGN